MSNFINFYATKPQSIIFVEHKWSNLDEEIQNFAKITVCENKANNFFCNNCEYCKKINNKKYLDFYEFNTYKQNFKKEEIIDLQKQFLYSSIEKPQAKFCVIKGIENLNKISINSLLKIIEEPQKNIYFIFSTRNLQMVYLTIRSRCSIINLAPKLIDQKKIEENYHFNKEENEKIFFTYYSFLEFKEDFHSNKFIEIKDFSNNILEKIKNKNYGILKKDLELFKKFDYYDIEKIFLYLFYNINNLKKNEYLSFIDNLKFNLSKVLIFNELIEFLE